MSRVSTRLVTKTELWLFLVSLFGICLKAIFSPLWRHLISPFLKRLRILRSVSESGCGHQHPEVFTILDTHLDFSVFSIQVVVAWTELQCSYSSSVACPGLDDSFWKGGLLLVQNSKSMYLFFPPQWTGYQHCKSDVIFQLEQGEELWREGPGFLRGPSPGGQQGPGLQWKVVPAQ